MGVATYFFDSYAFIEIYNGSKAYAPYMKSVGIITTQLNLIEVHYAILRTKGAQTAKQCVDRIKRFTIPITNETIHESNTFRLKHKRKKLSFADCVGYVLACKNQVPFLTGDKGFKDLPNVEYVK